MKGPLSIVICTAVNCELHDMMNSSLLSLHSSVWRRRICDTLSVAITMSWHATDYNGLAVLKYSIRMCIPTFCLATQAVDLFNFPVPYIWTLKLYLSTANSAK